MEDNRSWSAQWIWANRSETQPTQAFEMVYFRCEFHLPGEGEYKLVVDVSADSRYRLYLNGKSVMAGPCRGGRYTHYYDIIDLSGLLKPGSNVLSAKMLHYGEEGPAPLEIISSHIGAFLLQGSVKGPNGSVLEELSTA